MSTVDTSAQAAQALSLKEERGHLVDPAGHTYVAHCNHYNCFLQKTLQSQSSLEMREVMVDVASTLFFLTFAYAFGSEWPVERRLAYVESFFKARGYGNPNVTAANHTDTITASASHHSEGYLAKFGEQDTPQDLFLTGALQGALTATYGRSIEVKQTKCLAMGDGENAWILKRENGDSEQVAAHYLEESERLEANRNAITHGAKPRDLPALPIMRAVRNMDLLGDPEDGLIPAFNVYLTFIPSLYYNICSQIFMQRIQNKGMSKSLGKRLLREAGHVCGFYTLGNILLSSEYSTLRTSHFGPNPDEWESMAALFGVINAFGWGYWELEELSNDLLHFTVTNSYEAYNYYEYFDADAASEPVCMLHQGGGAAIMNAMRYGNILNYSGAINRSYVNSVFEDSDGFQCTEDPCAAIEGLHVPCHFYVSH
jgi:hypothetical protein